MKLLKKIMFITAAVIISCCQEQAPVSEEGNSRLELTVIGDTSITGEPAYVSLSNAKVTLSCEYGYIIKYTDERGSLNLEGIPSSTYDINARLTHPSYNNILLSGTIDGVDIISGSTVYDTITAVQISSTGIAINEIYTCGPANNIFFYFDQYLELYNYSGEIRYLDGMMIARVGGGEALQYGADQDNDGDLDVITYIFKFPGSPGEENYPFYPGTFLVIAAKATNHKNTVSTSIDLTYADWEFYNQYSTSDFDNPNVPNLLNMISDKTVDFQLNLVSDVVIITDGKDDNWEDGIDISSVIDGVQYRQSLTSEKTIDPRVDKGMIISPPKYSGRSMQRVKPGEDTNNGTSDWEILFVPTPGWQ